MKDELIRHCRDRAFYAYGTSRLFERRANNLSRKRLWITFLGIAVPLIVGGTVLAFGTKPTLLPYLLILAGVVGTIQLVLSAWSIVARWDERHAYAIAAHQANTRLHNSWSRFIKLPPSDPEVRIAELDTDDQRQEQSDISQHISDKEKRFAMRAVLHYNQLPCSSCKQQPVSMKPSQCDTCGNF